MVVPFNFDPSFCSFNSFVLSNKPSDGKHFIRTLVKVLKIYTYFKTWIVFSSVEKQNLHYSMLRTCFHCWFKDSTCSRDLMLNMALLLSIWLCLVVRSHVGWRGERNVPYKNVETSP